MSDVGVSAPRLAFLTVQRDEEEVDFLSFPIEAFFALQERLADLEAEGVGMPAGTKREELALRILTVVELSKGKGALPRAR